MIPVNKYLLQQHHLYLEKSPEERQKTCHRIPVNNIKPLKNEGKTMRKHLQPEPGHTWRQSPESQLF